MEQKFKIKVTGGGTIQEIKNTLNELLESIEATDPEKLDGITWEDATLLTEIELDEDEGED